MDESVKHNYELAFHINSNLEEPAAQQQLAEIEKIITDHGGVISYTKAPERTHLSYQIRHQDFSYFGYTQFSLMDTQQLASIDEQIKLHGEIMRYVILKMESDEQRTKAMAKMAEHQERKERRAKKAQQTAEAKPKDSKEMEKKLEEIIGNL